MYRPFYSWRNLALFWIVPHLTEVLFTLFISLMSLFYEFDPIYTASCCNNFWRSYWVSCKHLRVSWGGWEGECNNHTCWHFTVNWLWHNFQCFLGRLWYRLSWNIFWYFSVFWTKLPTHFVVIFRFWCGRGRGSYWFFMKTAGNLFKTQPYLSMKALSSWI